MEDGHDVRGRVLEIIRAALLNNAVTLDDNIFAVGGDSLTFLEICSEIEDAFEIDMPLESAWAAPSIAELSSIVERCLAKAGRDTLTGGR